MEDIGIDPDLESTLRALEGNAALRAEDAFLDRAKAQEELEGVVFDRLAGFGSAPPGFAALRRRAETLQAAWEGLDQALFLRLRTSLRAAPNKVAAFKEMWEIHVPTRAFTDAGMNPGYDARDAFLNGLLHPGPMPTALRALEPEMVPFQKTSARILLEMIARAGLGPADVFCDVGSGLGQIPIAIHLLTGARVFGIEREPAYVAHARACAAAIGLSAVAFVEADARAADYSAATVLFLYTPFRGRMLEAVLERMQDQCRAGTRLFAYGPCAAEVAGPGWRALPGFTVRSGLAAFAKP